MENTMTGRRAVLFGGSAALLAGPSALAQAIAPAGSGGVPAPVPYSAPAAADVEALEQMMVRTLTSQLGDVATARTLAATLAEAGFRWDYPQMPVREADSVVAYSFGYRSATGKVDPNTGLSDGEENPQPGPINDMLADAVHAIARMRKIRVYAQWEIADVLRGKYGMKDVVPILPVTGSDGKKTYLSTDGVAKAVVQHAGGGAALGSVAVVGHRDHAKRCIMVSQANGMKAAAAREVPLPVQYDPQSAQPWTRKRDAYLLSDVLAQLMMARARI